MNFIGVCKAEYNLIDQKHIDAKQKKIWVTTHENMLVQAFWGTRRGKALFDDRVIVHILGRGNYSHVIDRPMRYYVEVKPSYGGKSRLVLSRNPIPVELI